MKCPLLIIAAAVNNKRNMIEPADCLREACAWWEERFAKCCVAVPAYLTGVEDARREVKHNRQTPFLP